MPSHEPRGRARVRSTPKLIPFMIGAPVVAFTAAVITVTVTPPAEDYTTGASIGTFTMFYTVPCLMLAAVAYLATEKIMRRRATTYDMERLPDNGRVPHDDPDAPSDGNEAPRSA
ncbi:hypothetical protein [Nesterenkonia sp. NBAIMH1]|uniref:hypothetical protein n=1 Tax=Nesterenkonia sp. NBAIMH1 TaxID=2600320 RepID=UPI0011B3570E|nr:hypothetical protein [Nesterenkonia sp. NBAIMH1]